MDHIRNSPVIDDRKQQADSLNSAHLLQNKAGRAEGERVRFVPVSQSLADGAEELTFAFSERVGKSLAKRKIDDALSRLSQLEKLAQEYLHKVPDLEQLQKITELVASLRQGQLSTVARLQAYLDGFSKEISHQFIALSQARVVLAAKTDAKALLALIDQALSVMAHERGDAIEMGIVISPLAAEVASHPGEIQAIRESSRDAVSDCNGLAAAMSDIRTRFGNNPLALEKIINFLMKMLATDYLNIHLDQVKRTLIVRYMRYLHILKKLHEDSEVLWKTLITQERCHGIRPF